MPLYEYVCERCARHVDVLHGIDAPGPTACAECGGSMRKALSAPAIHFKGSGWAKVDARAASGSSTAPSGASSAGSEAGERKSKPDQGEGKAGSTGGASPSESTGSKPTTPAAASTTPASSPPTTSARAD